MYFSRSNTPKNIITRAYTANGNNSINSSVCGSLTFAGGTTAFICRVKGFVVPMSPSIPSSGNQNGPAAAEFNRPPGTSTAPTRTFKKASVIPFSIPCLWPDTPRYHVATTGR